MRPSGKIKLRKNLYLAKKFLNEKLRSFMNMTPDLQAILFCGSMPSMLQAFMSAFTQSDNVSLGLPRAFEHGTDRLDTDEDSVTDLVTDLIQDEDRTTCQYHLRRLERTAAVPSCIPSHAHNKSMEISSCGLTPQIHRIIDLSFRRSRCKSGAVGAQVSLP